MSLHISNNHRLIPKLVSKLIPKLIPNSFQTHSKLIYKLISKLIPKMNASVPTSWIDLHVFQYRYWGARDVGYHGSNIVPKNNEGCVGKSGIDKTYSFMQVAKLAKDCGANIIIKNGKKGKWYLKRCKKEEIQKRIEKQAWRDTSRCRMYEIE